MLALWTVMVASGVTKVLASCNSTFSVPVAEAQLLDNGRLLDVQQNNTYSEGDFWSDGSEYWGCPCNRQPCIFKCCPLDEEMEEGRFCMAARNGPIPSTIQLLHHHPCPGNTALLAQAEFNVTWEGYIIFEGSPEEGKIVKRPFTFCVDRKHDGEVVASVCPVDEYYGVVASATSRLGVVTIFIVFSAMSSSL